MEQDSNYNDNTETIFSISTIMMKLPTKSLKSMREIFLSQPDGLPLLDFIQTVMQHMELNSRNDAISVISDLVDFFTFVDVNGNGLLQWEEFVSFLVDRVVTEKETIVLEKLECIENVQVQSAATRQIVRCTKFIHEVGKLFMAIGQEIFIYDSDFKSSSWTRLIFKLPLQSRALDPRAGLSDDKDPVQVIDIAFSKNDDILCILRSDICFEFFHFTSRSKLCKETISPAGTWTLDQPYDKIVTKDFAREPGVLLAVGKTKIIDVWTITLRLTGMVVLEECQPLVRHKDYVRDILVIDNDLYHLFVSCAMDKKVFLWDLENLTYKATRTGHTAGVQCLSYDGKSILLAGGFDFSIVAWDMDAEIDRPLFRLCGHTAPVHRIVTMHKLQRCISLDASGELKYWKIPDTSYTDKDDHLLATTSSMEDHFRSFDVIQNLGQAFNALHDILIVTAGRRKHVYKLTDISPTESVPICALFSSILQTIVVVHLQDVRFWNAVTGQIMRSKHNFIGTGEASVAILDSIGQKLLVAESKGTISIFNCLDGCMMKCIKLPTMVRFLLYSPDRTIIALSGAGDVFVIAEFPSENDTDLYLRRSTVAEKVFVACAFSHKLGLIAAADSTGTVIIWDYLFFTIELIVENSVTIGASVGQMQFIDPFPLLLISDNLGNFTIIIVGPANTYRKDNLWRVKSVYVESLSGSGVEDENDEVEEDNEDDYIGITGARAKPLNAKKVFAYRKVQRHVKCMTVHTINNASEDSVEVDEEGDSEEDSVSEDVAAHHDHESPGASIAGATTTNSMVSNSTTKKRLQTTFIPELLNGGGALPFMEFPSKISVYVLCGYDDGTVALHDITETLKKINVGPIRAEHVKSSQPGYNPFRKISKTVNEAYLSKVTIKHRYLVSRKRSINCRLQFVWAPHHAPVVSVSIVGEKQFILTASEDGSVQLWSLDAHFLGILTRGSERDRVLHRHWRTPVDSKIREATRRRRAEFFYASITVNTDARNHQGMRRNSAHKQSIVKPSPTATAASSMIKRTGSLVSHRLDHIPSRERAIGQLSGEKNYILSKQEVAEMSLAKKQEKALEAIKNIGKVKKIKSKRKRKSSSQPLLTLTDVDYYETLDYNIAASTVNSTLKRKTHHKDHYQTEMAIIQAEDPDNWGVTSLNTQRKLYQHYYYEKEKTGFDVGQDTLRIRLNSLSPDNNFISFVDSLKSGTAMDRYSQLIEDRSNQSMSLTSKSHRNDSQAITSTATSYGFTIDKVEGKLNEFNHSRSDWRNDNQQINSGVSSIEGTHSVNKVKAALMAEEEEAEEKKDTFDFNVNIHSQKEETENGTAAVFEYPRKSIKSVKSAASVLNAVLEDARKERKGSIPSLTISTVAESPPPGTVERSRATSSSSSFIPFEVKSVADEVVQYAPAFARSPKKTGSNSRSRTSPLNLRKSLVHKEADTPSSKMIITNREAVASLIDKFDDRLATTEEIFDELDHRRRRRKRSMRLAIRNNKNVSSNSDPTLGTAAQHILSHQSSVSGMLQIGKKQMQAELNWVRKVKFTMTEEKPIHHRKESTLVPSRGKLKAVSNLNAKLMYGFVGKGRNTAHKLTQQELLARNSFGPYKASDLLKALLVFMTLPSPPPPDNAIVVIPDSENKRDMSLDSDKDQKVVLLADFIMTDFVQSRPHFDQELRKYMKKKTGRVGMVELRVVLQDVVTHMCPLMTSTDLHDCMDFLEVHIRRQKNEMNMIEEEVLTEEQLSQLRLIFDFFDKERSGCINRREIMKLMESESNKFYAKQQAEFLQGGELEEETRIEESSVDKMMSTVELKRQNELDFDEFVTLFKNVV